jgi:hypothetical protein
MILRTLELYMLSPSTLLYLGPCVHCAAIGGARQICLEVVAQRPILFSLCLFRTLSWLREYPGSLPNLEDRDAREMQVFCVASFA